MTLKLLSRHSFVGTMVQVSAGARRGGMIGSNVRFQLSCLWQQEHPAASMSAAMSAWLKCANHTKPRIYPRARNSDGKPPSPPLVSRRPVQTNSKPKKKKKLNTTNLLRYSFRGVKLYIQGFGVGASKKGFKYRLARNICVVGLLQLITRRQDPLKWTEMYKPVSCMEKIPRIGRPPPGIQRNPRVLSHDQSVLVL